MAESRARSGCLGRLVKLLIVLVGLGTITGFVVHLATGRALQGSWRFAHAGWSEATVARVLGAMETNKEGKDKDDNATVPPDIVKAATRVGNALVSALTAHVTLEITGSGYRVDGTTVGARLGTSLLRAAAKGPDQVGGCTTGSFTAVFPLIHATCGDGTGRTLWFLITDWPGDRLELILLPLGTPGLRDKLGKLAGGPPSETARTAKELLTLRFERGGE